ncbi:hypothetical protein GFS31_14130 [Leptolyngbya sp. BL0902]|nr:hypothetical protein GFS31_14130 [Leptolyngbya sp. BL0902]
MALALTFLILGLLAEEASHPEQSHRSGQRETPQRPTQQGKI